MRYFPQGGYAIFSMPRGNAVFRCPQRFRHRPAHCDLLHLDLWHSGTNLLRDGGTYSYNCEPPWRDYFKSTAAHNTVQFDDHDQMPRLTRFLYGRWPRLEVEVDFGADDPWAKAEFMDWLGCRHGRLITRTENGLDVRDSVSGFQHKAVLRWRLTPDWPWTLTDNNECRSESCVIRIETDGANFALELTEGWESLYYLEKHRLPVLEVTIQQPTTITTQIQL